MNPRRLVQSLFLIVILFFPVLQAGSEQSPATVEGWNLELELRPLADGHSPDVLNLVPKQSIMMKAFVWFPATRTWIVDYPDWDMPGAGIEKTNTTVPNLERQHEGRQQYGHTQNYILTPVDIGTLELRQQGLDISAGKTGSEIVPITTPIRIQVELPEGVYSIEQFLPAYALEVEQEFYHYTPTSPANQIERSEVSELNLIKGEMLERRITIKAKGIRGSSIPPSLPEDDRYKTQSESHSKDVLGLFGFEGGSRVDSRFYTPNTGGEIELEEVIIQWWHLDDEQLRSEVLPGVSFTSVAVETYEEAIGLSWWKKHSAGLVKGLTITGIVLVALFVVFLIFRTVMIRFWQQVKQALLPAMDSDNHLFVMLLLSVLLGGRKQARSYFVRWQYLREIDSVPEELSRYFYESDERGTHEPRTGRLRVLRLCWNLRKFPDKARLSPYRLPEL